MHYFALSISLIPGISVQSVPPYSSDLGTGIIVRLPCEQVNTQNDIGKIVLGKGKHVSTKFKIL